jgi:hypothetical protein
MINVNKRQLVRYKDDVVISVTVPDGFNWAVVIVPENGDPLSSDVLTGMYNEPIIFRRTVHFGTHHLPQREYDAVLLLDNEEISRVRFSVIEENCRPFLEVLPNVLERTSFVEMNELTLKWTMTRGNKHDFLAIYEEATVDLNSHLAMIFTGAKFSGQMKVSLNDRTIFKEPLSKGTYTVMLMNNDQFVEMARTRFVII